MNYRSIPIFGRWQLFLIMLSVTIVNVAVAQKTANASESESAASPAGDSPGIVEDSPASENSVAPENPAAQIASSEASVQTECVPQCRSGFMCHGGLCVSKCNPPCAEGQMCTAEGECMAAVAPPPTQSRASVAPAQQNARLALYAERQRILDERLRERLFLARSSRAVLPIIRSLGEAFSSGYASKWRGKSRFMDVHPSLSAVQRITTLVCRRKMCCCPAAMWRHCLVRSAGSTLARCCGCREKLFRRRRRLPIRTAIPTK
jgi:hypothetical protein